MEHFPLVGRLHTDVLSEKYGQISAKIIRHDDFIRESHLVDTQGISRTYALTFFPKEKSDSQMNSIDAEIRSGKPIGSAFREHGYSIRKNVIDVYTLNIPEWLKRGFNTEESFAKARLSEFYAKEKDANPKIYGTVLEVYSPDFRGPVVNNADIQQINPTTEVLENSGFSKEDVWRRIGNDNDWSDVQSKVLEAKKDSLSKLFDLKRKIHQYLTDH